MFFGVFFAFLWEPQPQMYIPARINPASDLSELTSHLTFICLRLTLPVDYKLVESGNIYH